MSFPRYDRYKDSGVEWLGEVPEHWEAQRLRFVAKINPSRAEVGDLPSDTVVSFFPMEAIQTSEPPDTGAERLFADVETGYTYFRDEDVAIAKITPCFENGKRALFRDLTNGIGFGTTELIVLRALAGRSTPRHLYWLCASEQFMGFGEGSMYGTGGQKRVSDAFVKDFLVALPPPDEQQDIATFLDAETKKIDGLIEEQWRLIELLKEKRQAVISHAVTKGLNPDAPMKDSGIDWLGKVPAKWDVVPLRFLSQFISGGTPDKREASYWEGLIPWVSSKDMKVPQISDSEDHISERAVIESGLKMISAGHILIVVRGMILAHTLPVAMTCGDITINQDLKALKCTVRLRPTFLQFALDGLSSHILSNAGESAHGTKKLETDVLGQLTIPLPSATEQELIVARLNRECEISAKLTTEAAHVADLLQERRSALISAAVTGKIDVRSLAPSDVAELEEAYEPA